MQVKSQKRSDAVLFIAIGLIGLILTLAVIMGLIPFRNDTSLAGKSIGLLVSTLLSTVFLFYGVKTWRKS